MQKKPIRYCEDYPPSLGLYFLLGRKNRERNGENDKAGLWQWPQC